MAQSRGTEAAKDELPPTRASLLDRLKDWQDQTSWQEFFDTYWKLIYGVARKAGLTDAEAQDVVQETLVSVAKHMPNFNYDPALGFDTEHLVMTVAGDLIALSVLIFLINFFRSIKHGEKAEGNIWNSRSPEWQVPSPMPAHNYAVPFRVVGHPYDYGLPGSKYVEFISEPDYTHHEETHPETKTH